MDGHETKDEIDRMALWDILYREGSMDTSDLSKLSGITGKRVSCLVEHEWFMKLHGLIYIARNDPSTRRSMPMLSCG
jgi:hypothetical protein